MARFLRVFQLSSGSIKATSEVRPRHFLLCNYGSSSCGAALEDTIHDVLRRDVGQSPVTIFGWIRSLRHHKNVSFGMIFDGSTEEDLQVVLKPDDAKQLQVGTSLKISGQLRGSLGPLQAKEVIVDQVKVLGACSAEEYPIQNKEHSAEFLRTLPHLRPRTASFASTLRFRSRLAACLRDYLAMAQFTEITAPSIVFSDCEGGGNLFRISASDDLFGAPANLSISAQLHVEIAASAMGRVYAFGPVFRAENTKTTRHLNEFTMLEAEVAFINDINQLMSLAENMLTSAARIVELPKLPHNMSLAEERRKGLLKAKFGRISYTDAVHKLQEAQARGHKFEYSAEWGKPLQTEHERYLAQELFQGPVFVYDYPAPIKSFYMKVKGNSPGSRCEWQNSLVSCFDLLLPRVAEVIGGSLREDNLENLRCSMQYHGLDERSYDWYLELRKHGSVPHGGFGVGFDRLVQYLIGAENIRDVVLVPRSPGKQFC